MFSTLYNDADRKIYEKNKRTRALNTVEWGPCGYTHAWLNFILHYCISHYHK